MNKARWIIAAVLISFLFPFASVLAQNCQGDPCAGISNPGQRASCYDTQISQCKTQENTLSGEISSLNNQIRLTTLRIVSTRMNIDKLSGEINELGDEIAKLEDTLNQRLAILIKRIPQSYKRSVTPDFGLLLLSSNIADFITRAKYLSKVQAEDASVVFQVKATQNNYTERKQTREDKKTQLEQAKIDLENQNYHLGQQKQERDALLSATQGNEANYQTLYRAALAQLAAINRFVSSLGGASVLQNQTYHSDWGYYYNQRDSQWANHAIGSSSESLANVGCLVTSIAMVLSHYGFNVTPSDVASTLDAFVPGTAYMYYRPWSVSGATVNRSSTTISAIDGELSGGHPVIVGVYNGPGHFVVLKSGSNGNYVMNDPFVENGHDIDFTSHYSMGVITEVDTIRIN